MKKNKIKKERKKRIRWGRILALLFLIIGLTTLGINLNKHQQQKFEANILPIVNIAEKPDKSLDELVEMAKSQNIPIPKELQEKMAEEQRLKEEEARRIAEEQARIEAEKKAEEEAEEKARQEEQQRKLAQAKTQQKVTSRGGDIPRATSGTKAEYQEYAHDLCINTYGWTENDFDCLVKLWTKESNWNANAHNSSSGAHGIPQSLPASKMASEGSDYYTNGKTQIRWGLKYIKGRYGSPSNAWSFWLNHNWY